jgi:hypothetical protein
VQRGLLRYTEVGCAYTAPFGVPASAGSRKKGLPAHGRLC